MRRISVSNIRLADIRLRESNGDSIVWFLNVKVIKGDHDANHKNYVSRMICHHYMVTKMGSTIIQRTG